MGQRLKVPVSAAVGGPAKVTFCLLEGEALAQEQSEARAPLLSSSYQLQELWKPYVLWLDFSEAVAIPLPRMSCIWHGGRGWLNLALP